MKNHRWNLATRSCWDCGVLISQVEAGRTLFCGEPDGRRKIAVVIPAGALFTVTSGEYSDFSVDGVFRALKDIDSDALLKEWLTDHPEQNVPPAFQNDAYVASLIKKGLMEQVPAFAMHLGYRFDDEVSVKEPDPDSRFED